MVLAGRKPEIDELESTDSSPPPLPRPRLVSVAGGLDGDTVEVARPPAHIAEPTPVESGFRVTGEVQVEEPGIDFTDDSADPAPVSGPLRLVVTDDAPALDVLRLAECGRSDRTSDVEPRFTEFALPGMSRTRDGLVQIRGEESVIDGKALLSANPLQRASALSSRAFIRLRDFFTEDLRLWLGWMFSPSRGLAQSARPASRGLAHRLDALPTKKKIALVSAPYVLALLLALFLFSGSDDTPATTTPVKAPAEASPTTPPAAKAPAKTAVETAVETPPPAPAAALGQRRTLPIASAMFARPNLRAKKVSRLKAGASVHVYAELPAPSGWVVAQRKNKAIGYIPTAHLEGKRRAKRTKRRRSSSP